MAHPLLPSEGTIASGDSLLFVLLPLVLLAVWAMRTVMRRGGVARWGALIWWSCSSSCGMVFRPWSRCARGAPRPAINAAWQWVSLATMFFLVRQLVADGRKFRAPSPP